MAHHHTPTSIALVSLSLIGLGISGIILGPLGWGIASLVIGVILLPAICCFMKPEHHHHHKSRFSL